MTPTKKRPPLEKPSTEDRVMVPVRLSSAAKAQLKHFCVDRNISLNTLFLDGVRRLLSDEGIKFKD
jgi:hypothetical protein